MNNTDPVVYPTLRVGSSEYPVRISIATLVKLKQQGLDLFEQHPYDPQNGAFLQAYNALVAFDLETSAAADPEAAAARQETRAGLLAALREIEEKMTPERRNWREPLKKGTVIDQWAVCAKILAASISTPEKPVEYMRLLEDIEPGEVNAMVEVLTVAIKKVTAQIFTPK